MAGLCCAVKSVVYCMPNGSYIDLGGKKKTWIQNKTCRYISPRKHQAERERAFDLEDLLHVQQNSPNRPLEELRNLGTNCVKSFELHKMLMVALSQASC